MAVKDKVLKTLEQNQGKSVSGSSIAKTLNITRSAVWKAVKLLQDEGYTIIAATNKGYCLTMDNDIISDTAIKAYLRDESRYDIMVCKALDSTNTHAKLLAAQGSPDGSVVVAEGQTAGRGRMGRSFYSPAASGVYMSVVLRTGMPVSESLLVTAGAAVAVCRALEAHAGVQPQIKWVNDVYIDGKKVCGILTETVMDAESGSVEYMVVGIGINVRAGKDGFPGELAGIVTTVQEHVQGTTVSRNRLIAEILNQLDSICRRRTDTTFMQEYRSRSFLIGKTVTAIRADEREQVTVQDIDGLGRLVVADENGCVKVLNSGEISIRPVIT